MLHRSLLISTIVMLTVVGWYKATAQESNSTQLTTTTQAISNSEISAGTSEYVKARVEVENKQLAPPSVAGMPDFTDDGLSMLVSRAGRANPVYVSTCVRGYFTAFYGTLSGPASSAAFLGCDPLGNISNACDSGSVMPWSLTENQKQAWKNSSTVFRGKFITLLQSYKSAISGSAESWFPCIIRGLDYGGTDTSPYTDVEITVITQSNGSTYEWWVQLTR